ncbi:MAG: nucleotidyltransferase family protein [Campylobacterota bacterium]|nr:nucleotidyltransferase family protein [Campylobacterota bacterium]
MKEHHPIIAKLKELKPILKDRYGIEEFAVFGSVAKGTDTEKSDIDIAILKMQIKSGFDIFRAKDFLKEMLGRNVDMGTFNSMKTFIKNRIKKDFIYV